MGDGIPTGRVAFVFTDLESSTHLWEVAADAMKRALGRHDELLRAAIARHGGHIFTVAGDSFGAAFHSAVDAVAMIAESQASLRSETWPTPSPLRVRMGLHVGTAEEERDGNYFGSVVNRAARIMAGAHGGQALVSGAAASHLGPEVQLTDLGIHRLADLLQPEHLFQLVVQGDEGAYPELRTLERGSHNLPIVRTSLIGREQDVETARALLDEGPLLTLTGVGGVGKTRLALELAADDVSADVRVAFVDLGVVNDDGEVVAAVAAALGLGSTGAVDALDRVRRATSKMSTLVVLDGCEHVLDGAASVADALAGDHGCRLVATSREALGVTGERIYRLPSLATEASLALFWERATAALGDVAATTDDASRAAADEICTQLDGVPLALELAAARVTHLSVTEIAANLDRRFQLLGGSRRRAMERQQTLQATMDWSYGLLTPEEQRALRACGVFVGDFGPEAVAAVLGLPLIETIDVIGALVDKSLVAADSAGQVTRYRLLETVRMYALYQAGDLGELEELRTAHAEWFRSVAVATTVESRLGIALDRLSDSYGPLPDHDNVLAALQWFSDRGDAEALAETSILVTLIMVSSYWVDPEFRFLEREDILEAVSDERVRAVYGLMCANNANHRGAFDRQRDWAARFYGSVEDPYANITFGTLLANAESIFDPQRCLDLVDELLPQLPPGAREDLRWTVEGRRPDALILTGRFDEAVDELRPRAGRAPIADSELGILLHILGRDAELEALVQEHANSPWYFSARVLMMRGLVAIGQGDLDAARDAIVSMGSVLEPVAGALLDVDVLLTAAALAHRSGEPERCAALLASHAGGFVRTPASHALYVHYRDLARDQLGASAVAEIRERTEKGTVSEALERELQRLASLGPIEGRLD